MRRVSDPRHASFEFGYANRSGLVCDFGFDGLSASLPQRCDFFTSMRFGGVAYFLVVMLVELEDYGARCVLFVKINVEPVILGFCERHNDAGSWRDHSQGYSLAETMFLGVFVGELVDLVVGNG